MWVFIRPRGGQECYLLRGEIRGRVIFCPIHRFDGLDQLPLRLLANAKRLAKKCRKIASAYGREKTDQLSSLTRRRVEAVSTFLLTVSSSQNLLRPLTRIGDLRNTPELFFSSWCESQTSCRPTSIFVTVASRERDRTISRECRESF